MQIILEEVGRRFNKEWIFKELNYSFDKGGRYAILGPNGSGKSTLLSVLMGVLTPSSGSIKYLNPDEVPVEDVFKEISFAGPYLDLIDDFTLVETIDFHFQFKSPIPSFDKSALLSLLGLENSADKALKYFSSGMKQRTKLALAFCSECSLLVLDEPTSNLDAQGVQWYQELLNNFSKDRTLIIGSNVPYEYESCEHKLWINDFK
ncbi:MAG: ABC transporter ATP-binding protein [Pedobacter sp.]|nr:MAG: ABC transporter ATP-binding protein [Pedobacter sp.]